MTPITHVLYLHGFRSSPSSFKAQWLAAWFDKHFRHIHWHCPALPVSPLQASLLIAQTLEGWPGASTLVIGSSLGGFYATWAAAKWGCAAVLINPSTHPSRDLKKHIGIHTAWHDASQTLEVLPLHIEEMLPLYVGNGVNQLTDRERTKASALPDPQRLLAIIAKGDEVLDWQEMSQRYKAANVYLIEGSDHGLSDIADHVHVLEAFLTT
ncbi:MAG: YqiA/YcfP family alpha/beta fold hydrolase [Limnohabitans sp.]